MKTVCYGIDASPRGLIVTRSEKSLRRITHTPWIEGDHAAEDRRRRMLLELDRGKACATAVMPTSATVYRLLTAPFPSLRKARRVLDSLLDIQVPFPVEDCIRRYPFLVREKTRVQAVAVAARRKDIEDALARWRDQSLDPVALDHEGLALWDQSRREVPFPRGGARRIVAYLGVDRITLVWGQGRVPQGTHVCRRPEASTPGPADDVGTAAESLASRLRPVLHPLMSGAGVAWWWCGPGAARPEFLRALETALTVDALPVFQTHSHPGTFLARALAQRWFSGAVLDVDFRYPWQPHPLRVRREARRARRALAFLMPCLLGAAMMLAGWVQVLRVREGHWDAALQRLSVTLAPGWNIPRGQEALLVRRALDEQRALHEPFLWLREPWTSTLLDETLRQASAHAVTLERFSLGRTHVALRGQAEQRDALRALEELLVAWGFELQPAVVRPAAEYPGVRFEMEGLRIP